MKQFQRSQVIMLPTEESNLSINRSYKEYKIGVEVGKPYLTYSKTFKYFKSITDNSCNPIHLYIISNAEIRKSEEHIWYYDNNFNKITKWRGESITYVNRYFKKIIATTDNSLMTTISVPHVGGQSNRQMLDVVKIPQIPKTFIVKYIKKYNKGNIITDILVEYNTPVCTCNTFEDSFKCCYSSGEDCIKPFNNGDFYGLYPKINSKDNTITIKKVEKTLKDIMKKNPNIKKEVEQLIINCCGEVSCEDGTLIGKSPEELVKWIKQNL